MLLAENKYKCLKQSDNWGNMTAEEDKIVALNTKIEVLKNSNKPGKAQAKPGAKKKDFKKADEKKDEKTKVDFCWGKNRPNQTT